MPVFKSLAEAEKALEAFWPSRLKRFAYTTAHIARFLDHIANPQNAQRSLHIAGTSGKTSTAHYAAALLKAHGSKTGLLTSPHLEKITERVQIDLKPMPDQAFCQELAEFIGIVRANNFTLTYAELLYAFAYWEFAREHVEYNVVEVGMGGLNDATNVITREDKVCIITDIGLDHTNILGNSLSEIAQHKAGIIGRHNAVFCYPQPAEAMQVIQRVCRQKQAALHVIDPQDHAIGLDFLPLFQQRNFTLAQCAVQYVLGDKTQLSARQLLAAARARIPARMEIVKRAGKTIILDGAHNPQKLRALRESIEQRFPGRAMTALVAFGGGNRDLSAMLAELKPIVDHVIITTFSIEGHHPSRSLAEIAAACEAAEVPYSLEPRSTEALRQLLSRPGDLAVVAGSIYLAGQLRPTLLGY